MIAIAELAVAVGVAPACQALGVPRATFYRHRGPPCQSAQASGNPPPVEPPMDSPAPDHLSTATVEDSRTAVEDSSTSTVEDLSTSSVDHSAGAGPVTRPPILEPPAPAPRPSPRALTPAERQAVLDALHSPRFVDQAPGQVHATLLDEGVYHCSVRTMYRVLAAEDEVRERRNQLRHPAYRKPELLATAPNQVWSWDITKLLGPAKWTYFYLYVILDIFSRYVVGWMLASRESGELAEHLIRDSIARQAVDPEGLVLHSDRGAAMKSHAVGELLATLGVTKSHSRPHVSNDNPFSESQFKTLKYRPAFPERFGSHEDARGHCQEFFRWYNEEHYHSGIAMLTPAMVHHDTAGPVLDQRASVLETAYAAHPERFVHGCPKPPTVPPAVWINPPTATPTLP